MSQVAYEKSHFSSFHCQLREIEWAQSIPVPHNHFTRHPIVKRVHLLNSLIFHNYLATNPNNPIPVYFGATTFDNPLIEVPSSR